MYGLKRPPKIVTIPDNEEEEEEEEDWPESRPVNVEEAKKYMDHINKVFDTMAEMLHRDNKDTLPKCIRNFKKLITKHWHSMADMDPEVVIRTIYNPACIYLHQHVTKGGVDIIIPKEEPPNGRDFIRKVPKKRRKQEELELIIGVFNHACEAHSHLATVEANVSSLAKVMDHEMLRIVMKAAVRPLIQMNVLEGFLDPIEDKKPQMLEEELAEKVEKTILSRHKSACWKHEPKNRPMRILAAAVWLKLKRKYFNTGTAKEACELFQVRAKQLLQVLTGCKYLGGSKKTLTQKEWGKKRKATPATAMAKKTKKSKENNDDLPN